MEEPRHIRLAGADYLQRKHELQYSILLETDERVTIGDVLSHLPKGNAQWGAGYIAPGKFLLRCPLSWKRQAVIRGDVELGGNKFKVNSNISPVSLQSEWSKIWVRLIRLPYELRGLDTLSDIVQGFGTFVEVDHNTKENIDLRWARVRVSVPDDFSIPPTVPLKITNRSGETFVWRVPVETENEFSEPVLNVDNLGTVHEPNQGPAEPPILNPNVQAPNMSGPHITVNDAYPIPYLVHLDDIYADIINGDAQGIPTVHIPDFYPYGTQIGFPCYEQGNCSMDGTNVCVKPPAIPCEKLAEDRSRYITQQNVVQVTSGKQHGNKPKMKSKVCASKRRIDFGNTTYSSISANGYPNYQSSGSESGDVGDKQQDNAGNEGNPVTEASHSSPICTIRFPDPEEPIDATPLKAVRLARTSVRLACKRMERARERRMMRGGTSSAPHEEIISLSDDDEVNDSVVRRRVL